MYTDNDATDAALYIRTVTARARHGIRFLSLLPVLFVIAGCTPPAPPPTDEPEPESEPMVEVPPAIKHVIVVAWDGVRPDLLQSADTPHIDRLVREGSVSWNVWTVWRPITRTALPSLHTGALPSIHGMDQWSGVIHAETIAEVLDEAGLTSALIGSDQILGGGRATHATGYYWHSESAAHFIDRAITAMEQHEPTFMYVYNPEPDSAGHSHGHWSDDYREAIEVADQHLGRLLTHLEEAALLDDTVIVVTTDHGMTGRAHGYGFETDMRIFSIWRGPGIRSGYEMQDRVEVPEREAGKMTVQVHRIADTAWSEDTVTWDNQPALDGLVTETLVDATGVFSWDITTLVEQAHTTAAATDDALLSFALVSPHEGEGLPSPEVEDAFNPTLYSEINRAVFFNTTHWDNGVAHPTLHVIYHTADGEESEFRITPTANTMVLAGEPGSNYGKQGNFHVGYFGSGEARALFTFDLKDNLPEGATIQSAAFRATCWRLFPPGYPKTRVAHHLIDIAPTITHLLGLRPPRDATGRVIEQLLE